MILGIEDLLRAEDKGLLRVKDRDDFSAFSLDVGLGKLYERNEKKADEFDEHELNREEFIKNILERVSLKKDGLIINNNDFYLWQPEEIIYLAKGLHGYICSRSSWARLGLVVRSMSDDNLHKPLEEFNGRPLCTLYTSGTNFLLKPEDKIAQLIVKSGKNYISQEILREMIKSEEFVVKKDSKQISSDEVGLQGQIILTMGPEILIYNGSILEQRKPKEDDFERINISENPVYLPKRTFFLSTSSEYVEIPNGYVGYVKEHNFIETDPKSKIKIGIGYFPLAFSSHANAAYIGPRDIFTGNITFENVMKIDGYVIEGIKQSELFLEELSGQGKAKQSRYTNQKSVTKSRL